MNRERKNENIRDLYWGVTGFKKRYQPRTNIVKDEKGDLITDSHSILARWRNHSMSPRHGASSGCGWRNGLRYGG